MYRKLSPREDSYAASHCTGDDMRMTTKIAELPITLIGRGALFETLSPSNAAASAPVAKRGRGASACQLTSKSQGRG